MTNHPLAIENGKLEPGIVGTIAGGPNDCPDLSIGEIQTKRRGLLNLGSAAADVTARPSASKPFLCAHSSTRFRSLHLEIGERAHVAQRSGELCLAAFSDPCESADQPHSYLGEGIEVESRSIGCAGQLQRRNPARPRDVVDLVIALVEDTCGIHPPLQVLATIHSGSSNVLAHRQRYRASRAVNFVGDLRSARRCADHQHAAVGKLCGISVLLGGESRSPTAARDRQDWVRSDVACPRSNHHRPAQPITLIGSHQISRFGAAY